MGGASIAAVIRARLHGGYATAVSGVFATTGSSGDQYAGGFAGGRRTLNLAAGSRFSTENGGAARGTTTDPQGRTSDFILYAGDIDATATAANNNNTPFINALVGLEDGDHTGALTQTLAGIGYRTASLQDRDRARTVVTWFGPGDLRLTSGTSYSQSRGTPVLKGTQTHTTYGQLHLYGRDCAVFQHL